MELTEGRWTNKDLAEWFGIQPDSFKVNKPRKLEELEEYADFHLEKNKVIIDKVYIPVYSKKKSNPYRIIKDNFDGAWSENHLDTCSRVSRQIYNEHISDIGITNSTAYTYTLRVKNEFYGKAMKYSGTRGQCYYLIGKQEGDGVNARYSFLTQEEEEIKKEVLKKYYGSSDEKMAILDTILLEKEMSPEEFVEAYQQIMGDPSIRYKAFRDEFSERIGAKIARVTYLEKFEGEDGLLLEE